MRKAQLIAGAGALLALGACSGDSLEITNVNNPDVARALATPAGVEGVIGGFGVQINNAMRATESANTQAKILAAEGYASVANFGMAVRAQIPRTPISNQLGNDNQVGNLANFSTFQRLARNASNAVIALDAIVANGNTLGSAAQNARARAFAYYIVGQALGNTALAYDSAAIITPQVAPPPIGASQPIPPLSVASEVAAAALRMLDTAIAIANSAAATTGANGFPLPTTWLNGNAVTRDQFVRLARSYKARYRAGVARTAQERAAVDWNAVIADATNGITADFTVNVGGGSGWTAAYDLTQMYVTGGWHSAPYYYYGMADVSGGYDAWLATPLASRRAFLIVTPDLRFPQGATRAAQQAEAPTVAIPTGRYFRNRPTGEDVPLVGIGDSWYDHRRYGVQNLANNTGPYVEMSVTEVDMLAAEGYFRTTQFALAVPLVNKTRVKNGLTAIAATANGTDPIATGASCVPRVPAAPSFTSTVCGNLFDAIKYEKRLETAFTGYMVWFADGRGWGDIIEGTPIEWPVPYQEMQVRGAAYHDGLRRAPKGVYGF